MAEHETTADIIAWLRKPREGENAYLTLWRDEIADRLEAAHRRELSKNASKNGADFGQLGDAAKLREALENVAKQLTDATEDENFGEDVMYLVGCMRTMSQKCRTALAAPPRNCDRFATLPDALAAWRDIDPREAGPFDLWLFASATEKEGGDDADE
jgi:hypothetical protein